MKKLKALAVIVSIFSVLKVEARTFYESKFKATLHYTNIDEGSSAVFADETIKIRYSDDHDFCKIMIYKRKIPCLTFH